VDVKDVKVVDLEVVDALVLVEVVDALVLVEVVDALVLVEVVDALVLVEVVDALVLVEGVDACANVANVMSPDCARLPAPSADFTLKWYVVEEANPDRITL
jgi:hypothetical protein